MASTPLLSLSDPNDLNEILNWIELNKDDNAFDKLVLYFPFQNMLNKPPETVSILIKILTQFLNNKNYLQNKNKVLCYTVKFVFENIIYFSKKNEDCQEVNDLVRFLCNLFSRVKFIFPIDFKICIEQVCAIIHPLLKSENNSNQLKHDLALLITEIVSMPDVSCSSNFDIVDICISDCFFYLKDNSLELCLLTTAILRAFPRLKLGKENLLYGWIHRECPRLLENAPNDIKVYILDCIVLAFKTNEDNDFKLSKILRNKLTLLYKLLTNSTLYVNVMNIFLYIIIDLCKMGILPLIDDQYTQNLKAAVNDKNKWEFHSDIILIINYLRCLMSTMDINREEIINYIRNRCINAKHYPPIILKAVCLLYPIFVENNNRETAKAEKTILDAVEESNNLSEIITHHSLQMQWFLGSNRTSLKVSFLEYYLLNCNDSKIIISTLEKTHTTKLLLMCLLNGRNEKIQDRAVELIVQLESPLLRILIQKQLPASIGSQRTMGYLFKAKPAVPDSLKELLFFCSMISNVLPLLSSRDAFIGACSYTSKMLTKNKTCSEVLEKFIMNKNFFIHIYEAATKDDDNVAISAVILLIIFLNYRKLLKGCTARVLKALTLLSLVLTASTSNWVIHMKKESILDVYQYLLQLERPDTYAQIFATMRQFLSRYCFLADLTSTAIYVEMHCVYALKREDQIRHFLLFLNEWLKILCSKPMHLRSILENVRLFLKSQPSSDQIEKIMKLRILSS